MPLPQLRFTTYNRPVSHFLLEDGQRDRLDFDPPYQRGLVWNDQHRTAVLKSLFMGLSIGAIHLNRRSDLAWMAHVVDGKQRIHALRAFHTDQISVPASWFEAAHVLAAADGWVKHSGLSSRMQSRFHNALVGTFESSVTTVEEEAEIFMLINGAGVAQTDASMARAASFT